MLDKRPSEFSLMYLPRLYLRSFCADFLMIQVFFGSIYFSLFTLTALKIDCYSLAYLKMLMGVFLEG